MSENQRIRYALKDTQFKEISKGKGVMNYHLVDEFGNDRVVKTQAKLNLFNKVKSIRPMYHRETPLVNALAKASLHETIEVDYTEFNKKFSRGSIRSKKLSVVDCKVSNVDIGTIDSLSSLFDHKTRLMKLLLISLAIFSVLVFFFIGKH